MADLAFAIVGAAPVRFAAAPHLAFQVKIDAAGGAEVHTVALRCQIQIEATRRHYTPDEQARLVDLFGEPERWSQTLRTMLWTHTSVVVPGFTSETVVDMPVPCTFDFNVAATKYFHGLDDGDLPLRFLFSGTVFYADEASGLQVAPISWQKEAAWRLPVAVWRDVVDEYYPNTAWLCLRRDVFQRLLDYKARHGIPAMDDALGRVLDAATAEERVGS